ncbi:unnamed protein product [Porites lobata]|uniref:Uncharacterized protein n=1 Tax=Porites lobata TaxID=104759 RepID=A0ABN8PWW6_9CNID|nr:unnamed protein product [Porites lobata]
MSAFLRLTEQQKKALFAALSRKDVFTILSTGHGKLLITPPCNNFGCLSSPVSCGLAYPRTAKPWRLSNQFEQSRR